MKVEQNLDFVKTVDSKFCSRCKKEKSLDQFYTSVSTKDGYFWECKSCRSEMAKAKNRKFYGHGLTRNDFASLLEQQDYRCLICQMYLFNLDRIALDHDHGCCPGKNSCGKCIRGILCQACNAGLGMFKDSINSLYSAINYLRGRSTFIGEAADLSWEMIDIAYSLE